MRQANSIHTPNPSAVEAQPALIPLEMHAVQGEAVPTVSARELHAYLDVGRDYTTWLRERIDQYGFHEGLDFVRDLLPNIGEKGQGRPKHEFWLTLDMAKELAMVERNYRGREARRYFIECERLAREKQAQVDPLAILSNPATLRTLLLQSTEALLSLQAKLTVVTAERDAERMHGPAPDNGRLYPLEEAAAHLNLSPTELGNLLVAYGWVHKSRRPFLPDLPRQEAMRAGYVQPYFATRAPIKNERTIRTTMGVALTGAGLAKIASMLIH